MCLRARVYGGLTGHWHVWVVEVFSPLPWLCISEDVISTSVPSAAPTSWNSPHYAAVVVNPRLKFIGTANIYRLVYNIALTEIWCPLLICFCSQVWVNASNRTQSQILCASPELRVKRCFLTLGWNRDKDFCHVFDKLGRTANTSLVIFSFKSRLFFPVHFLIKLEEAAVSTGLSHWSI